MPIKDPEMRKIKQREYQKKHYAKNKQYYIDKSKERRIKFRNWFKELKLQYKCIYCGENHPACIEFHHPDPSNKTETLNMMVRYEWAKDKILVEIEKCESVCANCHKKIHSDEDGSFNSKAITNKFVEEAKCQDQTEKSKI